MSWQSKLPCGVPCGGWGIWIAPVSAEYTADGTQQSLLCCGKRPMAIELHHTSFYYQLVFLGRHPVLSPVAISAECTPGLKLTAVYQ